MASPFSIFRKNQRIMMVVIGVGCMVGFLLGGMGIIEGVRPGRGGGSETNTVVVSWDGGELTEQDIDRLRVRRSRTRNYLLRIAQQAIENGGTPKGPGVVVDQRGQLRSVGISQDTSDQAIVQTKLMAEKAESMGFTVSNDDVKKFILGVSDESISDADLADILKRVGGDTLNDQLLFESLRYELLAQKLQMLGSQSGMIFSTPGEMWQYYNRINRQVEAEVIPIAVSDFTDSEKIPTPSTAQLKAFYEEHKNQASHPALAEPGFRQREQIAFGYFQANLNDFMEGPQGELAKVTEEEIKAYYEKNKDNSFRQRELPSLDDQQSGAGLPGTGLPGTGQPANGSTDDTTNPPGDTELTPPENAETPPAEAPESETPAESPADDSKADPAEETPAKATPAEESPAEEPAEIDAPAEEPASEEPSAEDPAPEETPADEPAPAEEPAPEEPAAEEPAAEEETPSAPAADDSSSSRDFSPGGAIQLASYVLQDEAESEAPAEEPSDEPAEPATDDQPEADDQPEPTKPEETPAESVSPAEEAPAEETPAEAAPAEETPAEQPTDEPAEERTTPPSDSEPADAANDKNANAEASTDEPAQPPADPGLEAPATEPKQPKYTPLEKVKDEIRRSIAQPRAVERMQQALDTAKKKLRPYSTKYLGLSGLVKHAEDNDDVADQLKEQQKELEQERPNYQAIANELGLTYGEIPLVNQFEIDDYSLGKVSIFDRNSFQQIPFAALVYGDRTTLYKLSTIGDQSRRDEQFLYWATDKQAPRVPEFSELYNEKEKSGPVLESWKMQQALPLAKQEAKQLAEKSNQSEQTLQEQFQDDNNLTVLKTNPFSWLTSGGMPMGFGQVQISPVAGVQMAGADFMQSTFSLDVGQAGVAVNQPHTIVYVVHVTGQSPSSEALRTQFAAAQFSTDRRQQQVLSQVTLNDRSVAYRAWVEDIEKELGVKWMR